MRRASAVIARQAHRRPLLPSSAPAASTSANCVLHPCRQLCTASSASGRASTPTTTTGLREHPHKVVEDDLWVSYTDHATLRKRLVMLAQQVLQELPDECQSPHPPELRIPQPERLRHGFWFMRFAGAEQLEKALAALNKKRFSTRCGSLRGILQLDRGSSKLDLRAMLNQKVATPDPIEEWLRTRFSPYGTVESVVIPRVRNGWDGGTAYVRFSSRDEADAALMALDGTIGPTNGVNLYIDFSRIKPLRDDRSPLDTRITSGAPWSS